MKTAYKYRAYPSMDQKAKLDSQTFIAKNLYALLLEKSKAHYKETWKALTEYRTNFWICDKCVVPKDRT
ncbi:MAG: helix-turn-helix domain-containing protein, partial [Candidatus Micrarchaeaceae archaeon]